MDINQKKTQFLNSLDAQNISPAEIVKFLLPHILEGTDIYTLLTRANINHCSTPICEKDVENFYKIVYDTWFSSLSKIDPQNSDPAICEIVEMLKSEEFAPQNISAKQAKEFLENQTNRFLIHSVFPVFILHSRKILNGETPNNLFVYVKPSALHRKFKNCECRLYLNLKPKNAMALGAVLGELCEEKNIPLCYKFWTANNERNDSFLIYTNYDHVSNIVKQIQKIEKTNPELFDGCEQSNPFLAKVDNFIFFGEEPQNKIFSFTRTRSTAIAEFLNSIGKTNLLKIIENNQIDKVITNKNLEKFFEENGISISNPYLNYETQKELEQEQNKTL